MKKAVKRVLLILLTVVLLLPLAAGMAVLDALDSLGAQGAALKWPNDIVAQRDGRCRKLAGILCEHRVGQQSFAVCGIGVNLLQPQEVFDGRGLPDAGSVLGVLGASLKREELLRAIGQSLQKRRAQAAALRRRRTRQINLEMRGGNENALFKHPRPAPYMRLLPSG